MKLRAILLAVLALTTLEAAEVKFAKQPEVRQNGTQWSVAFALSARADVEVAVLNAKGKIVRHLAAGVLGGSNPPPEPLKPGLDQMLAWDGKDDLGRSAEGGPFSVRVRAGMGVKFGRMLGGSPYTGTITTGGPCDGVALAPDGTLYVKMASLVPQLHAAIPWQLRKFGKDGQYLKTMLPYAATTEASKTPGFKLLDTGTGALTPANSNPLDVGLFNFGDNIYSRLVNGSVVFIDTNEAKLHLFKVDGSNEMKSIPMRSAPDKLKWAKWLAPQLAFSPDGKYAYYSNVANTPYDGRKPADIDPQFPQGRVYRQDLTAPGANPERFYDLELPDFEQTKYWMPSAWDKKTAAAGIDTDAKGNLLLCDLVNQEVVEISPAGKKLSATKVPWPDKVIVNRKDNSLYVVSCAVSRGHRPAASLLKVSGRGAEAKVVAKLPLTGGLGQTMALDDSGSKPVLWLGGGSELTRFEDQGSEVTKAGESIINRDKSAIAFVCYGDVDPENELVYITEGMGRVWRYHGETGEGGLAPIKACDLAIGPGGLIYTWGDTGSYSGAVHRYSSDYKPAPLASTGKNSYGKVYGRFGRGNNAPGMAVDARGWVYVACGFNDCHVRAYDADGKLVDYERKAKVPEEKDKPAGPALIGYVMDQGGSLRADAQGNIYVLEIGLPKGFTPPKGFEKDPGYLHSTGTIYKFTPKGGEFKKGKDGWEADGAIQQYPGCGPNSGSWNSTMSVCHCTRPRFGLDGFNRLLLPHGFTYQVALRDNANNEILSFGQYGNYDAQGPRSSEPKPEIPLGWPIFAGASDKYIYVGDGLNHRVVRVDKTWAAEAVCAAK